MAILTTERLILRPFRESDFEPFAHMNADPRVMEFLSNPRTKEESYALARRIMDDFRETDDGFDDMGARKNSAYHWVVTLKNDPASKFMGFIALKPFTHDTHFAPAIEIVWRLAHDFWGYGYATEGAFAVIKFGFQNMHLNEIVSMTVPENIRSRRVMEKLGMTHNPQDDFNHPRLPVEHPMSKHVLYRLKKSDWVKKEL